MADEKRASTDSSKAGANHTEVHDGAQHAIAERGQAATDQ
jgi:hypothetical protein